MRLADFYGRRIKRRTGEDPARLEGLRPSVVIGDGLHDRADSALLLPEVEQRAVPAAPQGRRGFRRPKTRA
jgi:hypothetical protein